MPKSMEQPKEGLREVDWVQEQTRSALSGLKKDVLYEKKVDKVKYSLDTPMNYLKTLDGKKTYKEIMAENSGATVMSIQILLESIWYDVGEIDGVLVTKWKSTSHTMDAIKKFQADNWLKADGIPGRATIDKLLAVCKDKWIGETAVQSRLRKWREKVEEGLKKLWRWLGLSH